MTPGPDPRRWQALALVCTAFFMTILDVSIVNVALPSIKTSLNVSDSSLQWVLIAYAITFGGFLLLANAQYVATGDPAALDRSRRAIDRLLQSIAPANTSMT